MERTSAWDDLPGDQTSGRAPGEPGCLLLAALNLVLPLALITLGVLFVLAAREASLMGAVGAVAVAVLGAVGGMAALRYEAGVFRWVADLSLAFAAVHGGIAVGALAGVAGASARVALLSGALVGTAAAAGLYGFVRRMWLQMATVGLAATSLLGLLSLSPQLPPLVEGVYLLVLAGFVAAGTAAGVLRPVPSGYAFSAVVALAGAQALITGRAGLAYVAPLVAVAVLLAAAGLAAAAADALLRRRGSAAGAAVPTDGDWLTAAGTHIVVTAPYPVVFDAAQRLLGGLTLQVADRAQGRLLAGPATSPILGVGLWAAGALGTGVRAVGDPEDVERFLTSLRAQVEAQSARGLRR